MVWVQHGPIADFGRWLWVFSSADHSPYRFKDKGDAQAVCDSWCRDSGFIQEPTVYNLFFDLRCTLEITGQSHLLWRDTGIPQLNWIMR